MNLQPVPVAASGPQTFRCCVCLKNANQAHGTVYADLDGKPFVAYYCDSCATCVKALDSVLATFDQHNSRTRGFD